MLIPAKYRKMIYAALVVVFAGLFAAGIFTPDQVTNGIVLAERAVAALASMLALLNVTPGT